MGADAVEDRNARSALDALRRLGIELDGSPLWEIALTHRSYANEEGRLGHENYERLEFLGDAVVELVVSEHLYHRFPEAAEGELAKMRASVVRADSLAKAAKSLGLGSLMKLGKGEEQAGGRARPSLLADLFEAVVGAAYLSKGLDAAKKLVLSALDEPLRLLKTPKATADPKTALQEHLQARSKRAPTYRLVRDSGPDHRKVFVSEVVHQGRVLGKGIGNSKKASEQAAAREALRFLGIPPFA